MRVDESLDPNGPGSSRYGARGRMKQIPRVGLTPQGFSLTYSWELESLWYLFEDQAKFLSLCQVLIVRRTTRQLFGPALPCSPTHDQRLGPTLD